MERAVLLQTQSTGRKLGILRRFSEEALRQANWMLSQRTDRSSERLQAQTYRRVKDSSGFQAQVMCDLSRSLARSVGDHLKGITVKFNVPRNCKTFRTRGFFFVELGIYPRNRLAIPIRKNRNLDRFFGLLGSGWSCKTYGLTPSLEIVAFLSKEEPPLIPRRNILGIDINNKNFAYSVLSPEGRVLKQGYLGQQIWPKKVHFAERRALLQSLNALKKLKSMRHRQRDFVYTNIGQMVREIILIAQRFEADVSIERLRRFSPKGRRFNKRVMTIPFFLFKRILEARCFDNGIILSRVDAYHTSRWCSHCGAVGKGHDGGNYSLFRCRECGQIVNADRKASLAVAVKCLLERGGGLPNQNDTLQISSKRVPVNGLVRSSGSDAPVPMAVPTLARGRGKPTALVVGS
jgi:IS605 OrfB family transposase